MCAVCKRADVCTLGGLAKEYCRSRINKVYILFSFYNLIFNEFTIVYKDFFFQELSGKRTSHLQEQD